MKRLTLQQLAKDYELLRPAITDHMIATVAKHMSAPLRYSSEDQDMRSWLCWRLNISPKQLDSVLLGFFVASYADDLRGEQGA